MFIKAKQRYKPFTHQAGVHVLLPGTSQEFKLYPEGVVEFTVMLDLEKGSIVKFGKRFRDCVENGRKIDLERLSFGVHKKQEWEGIYKRCNVEEFLPIWYHMAQWYHTDQPVPPNSLLETCFNEKDKIRLTKKLVELFRSGFTNLLYPQNIDLNRYGFEQEPLGEAFDPALLFSLGKKLIRSFFFQATETSLTFLPLVPKGIHCGRFLNIREPNLKIDFEWTKHLPRRLIVETQKAANYSFHFPKEIQEFRVKNLNRSFENGSTLPLPPGRCFFDKFKK